MAKAKEEKMVRVVISEGTRYAGPRGNYGPGRSVEVSAAEAKQLQSIGAAEPVESLAKFSGVANRETADATKGK
jgi:hypothetical protein